MSVPLFLWDMITRVLCLMSSIFKLLFVCRGADLQQQLSLSSENFFFFFFFKQFGLADFFFLLCKGFDNQDGIHLVFLLYKFKSIVNPTCNVLRKVTC